MSIENLFLSPGPFRIIENFLGDAEVERLLAYAQAHQAEFLEAQVRIREPQASQILNPKVRVSLRLAEFPELIRGPLEERILTVKDWAVEQLGMEPFEVCHLEMEMVAHQDGAFYKRHIDTMLDAEGERRTADRCLTAVYYFHAMPKGYSGGELRMHSLAPVENGGSFLDVPIQRDMLLLFPSWLPHEVRPVFCPGGDFLQSRFAINCWCNRARPGIQTN